MPTYKASRQCYTNKLARHINIKIDFIDMLEN